MTTFNLHLARAQRLLTEAGFKLHPHQIDGVKWMIEKEGVEPELVIREGEKVSEILSQIKDDPEVGILVLGANHSGEGPGPLVSQLVGHQGGILPVPVTIVPGSMTKEDIIAVS